MENPIEIQKYLEGVNYPADRQALIDKATEHSAPQEVLDALEGLSEMDYNSPTEVSDALSTDSAEGDDADDTEGEEQTEKTE